MAVNLVKGQKINLESRIGEPLQHIFLGCGWHIAKKKSGFLGQIFQKKHDHLDLDTSVVLFNEYKQFVEAVYFGQMKSLDGSIHHSGHNFISKDERDKEGLYIDLTQVPVYVHSMVVTLSSSYDQIFEYIREITCRLVDQNTQDEMACYCATTQGSYASFMTVKIERTFKGWCLSVLGEPCQAKIFKDMIPKMVSLL